MYLQFCTFLSQRKKLREKYCKSDSRSQKYLSFPSWLSQHPKNCQTTAKININYLSFSLSFADHKSKEHGAYELISSPSKCWIPLANQVWGLYSKLLTNTFPPTFMAKAMYTGQKASGKGRFHNLQYRPGVYLYIQIEGEDSLQINFWI